MRHEHALISLAVVLFLGTAAGPDAAAVREEAYKANNIGVGMLEQYRYDDAIAAFKRALDTDPGLTIARINLAIALFYSPDLESARKEAEAAVAAAPTMPQSHYITALIAKGQNRLDDAIASFQKVLTLDPTDVGASVNWQSQLQFDEDED